MPEVDVVCVGLFVGEPDGVGFNEGEQVGEDDRAWLLVGEPDGVDAADAVTVALAVATWDDD